MKSRPHVSTGEIRSLSVGPGAAHCWSVRPPNAEEPNEIPCFLV